MLNRPPSWTSRTRNQRSSRRNTRWPDKHGCSVLIPCKRWPVLCILLYTVTLGKSLLHGTRNRRPCITGPPVQGHRSGILYPPLLLVLHDVPPDRVGAGGHDRQGHLRLGRYHHHHRDGLRDHSYRYTLMQSDRNLSKPDAFHEPTTDEP